MNAREFLSVGASISTRILDIPDLLLNKQQTYYWRPQYFKFMFYSLRVIVGVGAAMIPFAIFYSTTMALIISAMVSLSTTVDAIFAPKDKWQLYSRASDQLWVLQIRESGQYDQYKDRIEEILRTEGAEVDMINSLQAMLNDIKDRASAAPAVPGTGRLEVTPEMVPRS